MRFFYKYIEAEKATRIRLQILLDSSPLACGLIDESYKLIEANSETLNLFEVTNKAEFMKNYLDFLPPLQPDGHSSRERIKEYAYLALETGSFHFEWTFITANGTEVPCEVSFKRVEVEDKVMLISYSRDMRKEKELSDFAFTDELTKLSTRRQFITKAEEVFAESIENKREFSIIYFDVDDFKKVNDTYGHSIGDEVLIYVAARAKNTLKRDTMIARYGGEEFIVMLPNTSLKNAEKTAWRIRHSIIESPFVVGNLLLDIAVSFGVATSTPETNEIYHVIDLADKALYYAKNIGKNTVVPITQVPPENMLVSQTKTTSLSPNLDE